MWYNISRVSCFRLSVRSGLPEFKRENGGYIMFQRDDYVYYASGGVCRISDICYAPLEGMPPDRQYYVLRSLHDPNGVNYVPVDSDAVFLRRLLTRQEAENLLEEIPEVPTIEEPNAKALRGKYVESMRKHDPTEWVRVIKTVYQRMRTMAASSHSQRLSDTERSFAEDAKRYLYAELSLALEVPVQEMERYIQTHVERLA